MLRSFRTVATSVCQRASQRVSGGARSASCRLLHTRTADSASQWRGGHWVAGSVAAVAAIALGSHSLSNAADESHNKPGTAGKSPAKPVAKPAAQPTTPAAKSAPAAASSSSAAADEADEDEDEDEDDDDDYEAAWSHKHESEVERSGVSNAHPTRPHVSSLVAAQIPDRIYNRDSDVLLQIYAPWCGACKMLNPIVDTVAKVVSEVEATTSPTTAIASAAAQAVALSAGSSDTGATSSPVPSAPSRLQVMVMDGEANVLPGFLTEEENRALPLVKFYPKCGSRRYPESVRQRPECQPVLYEATGSVERVINFVHEKMAAQPDVSSASSSSAASAARAFDLDAAHRLARAEESRTQDHVAAALSTRLAKDSESMPALKIYELVPCGSLMTNVMRHFMQSSYRSYADGDELEAKGHELFDAYRTCTEKEQKGIDEFWTQVKRQVDDAMEAKEKRDKDAQPPETHPQSQWG